jgi:hypothetical protein
MKRALTGLLALAVVLSLIALPVPAAAWGAPFPTVPSRTASFPTAASTGGTSVAGWRSGS